MSKMSRHAPPPLSGPRRQLTTPMSRLLTLLATLALSLGLIGGGSIPAVAATVGILSNSKPKATVVKSKSSVNLGVKFSTSASGEVVALQFYRSAKQKKAYVGSLWSSGGKLLGKATFPKSSKKGWQTVKLKKPVPVTKGKTYVVSYLASDGQFAVVRRGFAKKQVKHGITVPKKGGVYRYSKKSVLPKSANGSNYLVDVVFEPARKSVKAPSPTPKPTPTPTTPAKPAPPTPESPTSGSSFSIAVMPDTQTEVFSESDKRYASRTRWLVDNKAALNLAYVLHTGDNVNYGWLAPSQYTIAKRAINILDDGGIPYALAIGNHDTRVVGWDGVEGSRGYGGSAYSGNPECAERLGIAACKSWLLVRDTDEFNQTFPLSKVKNVGGVYEKGKVDNIWSTFKAADTNWLVLTIELWPRKDVLTWAEKIVADHPKHNVIIQTHHYLDGNGTVSKSNGGYGETAPSLLYEKIVSKYSNVKFVFSGHTGKFTKRTDTNNGNTVLSYLGNDLGVQYNPVRILTIDTATGKVAGRLHNPISNNVINGHDTTDSIKIIR